MEWLKIYVGVGDDADFMSILVNDENIDEKNKLMRRMRYREVKIFPIIMKKIMEEGLLNREYKIADFNARDDEDISHTNALIKEVNENSESFHKLWEKRYDNIDKVILEKDGEKLEFLANGRYTNSENAREIIHLAITRIFTLRNNNN